MVLPYLPSDLVDEILSWVPATSLKRFRSTCKRWSSLFEDQRFREKHFRRAPKQPRALMLKEFRIFPMSVDLDVVPPSIEFKDALDLTDSISNKSEIFPLSVDLNVVPPSIEFEDALDLTDSSSNMSELVDIDEVFHCDGLLLCITSDNRPVVWNPCLGETRWIQCKNGYDGDCVFALGYENNQSCRIYKILMCWEEEYDRFEIYELCSNSWRVVNASSFSITGGVCLKGDTYWIGDDNYLQKFCFTRETFLHKPLPSLCCSNNKDLSVVGEERLSLLIYSDGSSKTEMWVTNKITGDKLSWSKSFAVDLPLFRIPVSFAYTSLLIDQEKKVALCCNSRYGAEFMNMVFTVGEDDEYYTEIPIEESSSMRWLMHRKRKRPFIFNYVPSLVQIQSK